MKYFKEKEFYCKCGKCGKGFKDMDAVALRMVDKARDIAGVPFSLNSSIRCPTHNRNVGGGKNSAHLRGYAFDIRTPNSRNRYLILNALIKAGFNRIGIYKSFIHADCDPSLDKEVSWVR